MLRLLLVLVTLPVLAPCWLIGALCATVVCGFMSGWERTLDWLADA